MIAIRFFIRYPTQIFHRPKYFLARFKFWEENDRGKRFLGKRISQFRAARTSVRFEVRPPYRIAVTIKPRRSTFHSRQSNYNSGAANRCVTPRDVKSREKSTTIETIERARKSLDSKTQFENEELEEARRILHTS